MKVTKLDRDKSYCFVTYDPKDLYTNILYEDAELVLKTVGDLIKIDNSMVDLILDPHKYCTEWYHFNAGKELYKQAKGISTGRHLSKEISDLVLLYSEYRYLSAVESSKLILVRRYADDGFPIIATRNLSFLLTELTQIMSYYPKNLIINININRVYCNHLDSQLSVDDDVSYEMDRVHSGTYFKKFHKFAYLDPSSNHPGYVFKGYLRGML